MSVMLQHLLFFYKMGGKQLYYFQTNDGQGEIDVDKMIAEQQPLEDIEDQDCESCSI